MDRILLYENRKSDPIAWDASTEELMAKAFIACFNYLDKDWQLFNDLKEMESGVYEKATQGDADAARKILENRQYDEYCSWQIVTIQRI